MGIKTAPAYLNYALFLALTKLHQGSGRYWMNWLAYCDGCLCFSKTGGLAGHVKILDDMLTLLENANFQSKASKCNFGFKSLSFLGCRISGKYVSPDLSRVRDLNRLLSVSNAREARATYSYFSYYREFLSSFSQIAHCIKEAGKVKDTKLFKWPDKEQKAVRTLHSMLMKNAVPVLHHYDPTRETELVLDSSNYAGSAILMQKCPDSGKFPMVSIFSVVPQEKNVDSFSFSR